MKIFGKPKIEMGNPWNVEKGIEPVTESPTPEKTD
jgi:hypothetical protein